MIKLLRVDTSGNVPCPTARNLMLASLRGLKTLGGVSLLDKFPAITLELLDGEESPSGLVDYFKVGLLNVVSVRLKKVFEDVGVEAEFFPVTVLYHGEPTSINYFVANPLKRFAALDIENSDVDLDDELGDALVVRKMVIDESKFDDVKLAVISEVNRIGVQDEVALAVQSSGCTGSAFVEPESVRY